MKRRMVLETVVLIFAASAAFALPCTFDVSALGEQGPFARLIWDPVPGAVVYDIRVGTDYSGGYRGAGSVHDKGERISVEVPIIATALVEHDFQVFARNNEGIVCIGRIKEKFVNRDLAQTTNKKIIPLVGSVRGANGSNFRTSLTISKLVLGKGKIVFRPAGTVASNADPFLRYEFGDHGEGPSELHWDDVLAAMGATGTGSLEIVPEFRGLETTLHVPHVVARIYNVADGGTFGTLVSPVRPAEWFKNPVGQQSSVGIRVPPAHGNVRRNIGFRTLTPVTYRILVSSAPGDEHPREFLGSAPASYTLFTSLDAFVGEPVPAEAEVSVIFRKGFAIGFYTVTDDVTNDPSLVVQTPFDLEDEVTWGF